MLHELNILYSMYGNNEFSTSRIGKEILAVAVFHGLLTLPRIVNGSHPYTKFSIWNMQNKINAVKGK